MAKSVETLGDVSVEDVLWLLVDAVEDRLDRIMAGSSWAEPVAVWREVRFPLGLQCQFRQCLLRPIRHGGDAERAFLLLSGLWYPHPADRLRAPCQRQGVDQS